VAGVVSFILLVAVVVLVTLRPGGRAEVTFALPAALIVVAARLAPWSATRHELRFLAPTLLFLGAVFVVAEVAAEAGVFDAAGRVIGRLSGGSPLRLVLVVAVAATVTTTVLSLDTTAVLLTPVVIRVARNRRIDASPSLLATAQLANGGSLLLPVSNLTNLIVFPLTGLTFAGFALRMALPLVAAAGVITAVLAARVRSAAVVGHAQGSTETPAFVEPSGARLDRFGRGVAIGLVALLAAFFVGSLAHIAPSAIAAGGAGVLAVAALARRRTTPTTLVRAASPGFLVFVAALGVVVTAAARHGLDRAVGHALPAGTGFGSLLAIACVAAVLANAVNNLPATLVLLTALPSGAAAPLLAALIGVNVGPNLTYTGSLATLLWRRCVRAEGVEPSRRDFFTAAVIATPLALVAAVGALWLALRLFGST
jgi:arsenical pump membrane protein